MASIQPPRAAAPAAHLSRSLDRIAIGLSGLVLVLVAQIVARLVA